MSVTPLCTGTMDVTAEKLAGGPGLVNVLVKLIFVTLEPVVKLL